MKEAAINKIENEKKNTNAAEQRIVKYLCERCAEDNGLAKDIMQEHKSLKKCLEYIESSARKQMIENVGNGTRVWIVDDDCVYKWVENYFWLDDKEEEERKAKEEEERKKAAEEHQKELEKQQKKDKKQLKEEIKQKTQNNTNKDNKKPKEEQMSLFELI